ncbi:MAG: hypothetical protein JKY44_10525 [Flavobacteriaceae bacterium]|nr:hypothetical protein [Flavobacteriaceae bacterium]
MSTLKSIIEMDIVEEIIEDIEGINTVRNMRPNGFDTLIRLEEGLIETMPEGTLESSALEYIFKGFSNRVNLIPPLVLAKSTNIGEVSIFEFRGCFSVRSSNRVALKQGFKIYMKNSWEGTDFTPEFLMDFNCAEGTNNDPFITYQVNFKLCFEVAPKRITTYVWNQDPEGSRGTETTVQEDDD